MPDTVLSTAVRFVENHRYQFPAEDPASWISVTDAARGVPKNKIIYVFQAIGAAPFQLLKACRALASGELVEVTADQARRGEFPVSSGRRSSTNLPLEAPELQSRVPDTVSGQRVRYFFFVSRTALDGSFIDQLATNPAPELDVVTLDAAAGPTLVLGVTDPLTIAEQLANDYEKARRAYMALTAPFDEQSAADRKATSDLIKKRVIAKILDSLAPDLKQDLADEYRQQPADFLRSENDKLNRASQVQENAAFDCVLWLGGPLMEFVRSTYRVTEAPSLWVADVLELIKVEAAVCAKIADSYRGVCLIRSMITANHYLIKEFVARGEDTSSNPNLDKVQSVGKKAWDIISKFWIATGAIMGALEARQGPRIIPASRVSLAKVVRTYNTVFGEGILTLRTKNPETFKFREAPDGRVVKIGVAPLELVLASPSAVEPLSASKSSKNPFTSQHFARGIALINLALSTGEAYEALRKAGVQSVTADQFFTALKFMGAIVDTANTFPQQLARLLRLTGRGVAFLGLTGAVLAIATSYGDASNAWSKGDHDAALAVTLGGAGGLIFLGGAFSAWAAGGVVTAAASALMGVGAVLVAVSAVFVVLASDSDMDLFSRHCFLGKNHGRDPARPTWAPAPFNAWADSNAGLDHQTTALSNLVLAYEISSSATQPVDTLTIRLSAYYPGAVFRINVQGRRAPAVPRGAPRVFTPFSVNVLVDPTDATVGQISALEEGAITIVNPGQHLKIQARPRGPDRTGRVEDVNWRVTMDLGGNTAQNPGTGVGPGFPAALQGLVPSSGKPVTVDTNSSAKSTDF
jgi:hypothetical protein